VSHKAVALQEDCNSWGGSAVVFEYVQQSKLFLARS
jgi:hypothetical protein